jgi:hypothetical protein
MSTTFMGLVLPSVSVTIGPTWASNLNTALTSIDEHDHSSGKGKQVPSGGIGIDGNLSFNSYKITSLKGSNYTSESVTTSDLRSIYSVNGDLYYNNGSGIAIKLTSGTGINIAGTGTIGGDYGGPGINASVVYTDSIKTFTFNQAANTPAKMAFGDIILGETIASPQTITLKSPASLAASYSLTLPTALPASTKIPQVSSAGALSFGDFDGTTLENSSGSFRVKDLGVSYAKHTLPVYETSLGRTFTVTIATPGVVTATAHGYSTNDPVVLYSTGALPTGIVNYTKYFARNVTANTFELSATSGGASINTTGSQSGTHYVQKVTTAGKKFMGLPTGQNNTSTTSVVATQYLVAIESTGGRIKVDYRAADTATSYIRIAGISTATQILTGINLLYKRNGTNVANMSIYAQRGTTAAALSIDNYFPCSGFGFIDPSPTVGVNFYILEFACQSANTSNAELNQFYIFAEEIFI